MRNGVQDDGRPEECGGRSLSGESLIPYQELLQRLPVGAYICDRDGLITYFNEYAVKLWGRAPKLNDPGDRCCGSFKLFAPNGTPIPHDE